MTDAQRRMLNAVCGDLGDQLVWHGRRMSKDDYRHLIAGVILGWWHVPGIDRGEGPPGLIMFARSSLDLTREQAAEAITVAVHVGDHPEDQGLKAKPVRWSDKVLFGLGLTEADLRAQA
jgi:hypothetical protein